MKRDIQTFDDKEYDLVVVGGGIFGICSAWDAASRGLSVAMIEKHDFVHAASSNHFKMVHGGIRYLQHGDIARIRESSRERSALLRIAPHLVRPLQIVIPTYGYGIKGKPFIGVGLLIYNLITSDRNNKISEDRKIPWGKFVSKKEMISFFPDIEQKNLTGGVIFCDGQVYNPPRLGISFLRSAVNKGVQAANYVEAKEFITKDGRVIGVKARDCIDGKDFDIRGKWVLNTTGAWAQPLLESNLPIHLNPNLTFSRDLAFVVDRKMKHDYALAFSTNTRDADSIIDIGGRRLFMVPWRDYTLIGVWHKIYTGLPEKIGVTKDEMTTILKEVREAYSGLNIALEDIRMVNMGLTLFGSQDRQSQKELSFGKRSRIIDHNKEHGIGGLTTLIGVRATTARRMAQKAIDAISAKLGRKRITSKTEYLPIFGGDIPHFSDYVRNERQVCPIQLNATQFEALICNYGTKYTEVLKYIDENPSWKNTIGGSATLEAEIIHSIREEMAQTLSDVVFRRTELGTGGYHDEISLRCVADIAGKEMRWSAAQKQAEIEAVKQSYPRFDLNAQQDI